MPHVIDNRNELDIGNAITAVIADVYETVLPHCLDSPFYLDNPPTVVLVPTQRGQVQVTWYFAPVDAETIRIPEWKDRYSNGIVIYQLPMAAAFAAHCFKS